MADTWRRLRFIGSVNSKYKKQRKISYPSREEALGNYRQPTEHEAFFIRIVHLCGQIQMIDHDGMQA